MKTGSPEVRDESHLVRLHLQAGRRFIEDVIPPVEGELLPFFMANLGDRKQELTLTCAHFLTSITSKTKNITHSSFVTFHFDFDGF